MKLENYHDQARAREPFFSTQQKSVLRWVVLIMGIAVAVVLPVSLISASVILFAETGLHVSISITLTLALIMLGVKISGIARQVAKESARPGGGR